MIDELAGDVGGRLRRARQQRGLSLHEAAGLTKLSIYVLQAIERNDFDSLPAGMYRKAYVRTLAGEVGLDPNEIAAHYGEQCEPPNRQAAMVKSLNWRSHQTTSRPLRDGAVETVSGD